MQALLDYERAGKNPNGRIIGVISTNPDAYALERARQNEIQTAVCKKGGDILPVIRRFEPDLIICAGFLRILDPKVIDAYPDRIINVHPALLPDFGGKGFYGLRVHEAVLERGDSVTGATVHFVSEICDGGKVILQKKVAVLPGDTPETLQQRVMIEAERVILPEAMRLFCDDNL